MRAICHPRHRHLPIVVQCLGPPINRLSLQLCQEQNGGRLLRLRRLRLDQLHIRWSRGQHLLSYDCPLARRQRCGSTMRFPAPCPAVQIQRGILRASSATNVPMATIPAATCATYCAAVAIVAYGARFCLAAVDAVGAAGVASARVPSPTRECFSRRRGCRCDHCLDELRRLLRLQQPSQEPAARANGGRETAARVRISRHSLHLLLFASRPRDAL